MGIENDLGIKEYSKEIWDLGLFVVWIIFDMICIGFGFFLIFVPKIIWLAAVGIVYLIISAFFAFYIVRYVVRIRTDRIFISDKEISCRDESLEWQQVFITVQIIGCGRGAKLYMVFGNRYFTEKEANYIIKKRKGLYLNIDLSNRVESVLQYYDKSFRLFVRNMSGDIISMLHQHNKNRNDPREFL